MKVCTKCKRNLTLDSFYPRDIGASGKTNTRSYCKECEIKNGMQNQLKRAVKKHKEYSDILDDLSQDQEFKDLLINMGK